MSDAATRLRRSLSLRDLLVYGLVFVFALDGKATLPPNPVRAPAPIPAPTCAVKATTAETREGGGLWFQYCRRCHNPTSIS